MLNGSPFPSGQDYGPVRLSSRDCRGGKSHFSLRRPWGIIQQHPGPERCQGRGWEMPAPPTPPHCRELLLLPVLPASPLLQAAGLSVGRRQACCPRRGRGGGGARNTAKPSFKTFCSFDVNSRGSLRTEIRPEPGLGLPPESIPPPPRQGPYSHPCGPSLLGGALLSISLATRGKQLCPGVWAPSHTCRSLGQEQGARNGSGDFEPLRGCWLGVQLRGVLNAICVKKWVICQNCLLCTSARGWTTSPCCRADYTNSYVCKRYRLNY